MDIEVKEEVEQRTQQAERFEGKKLTHRAALAHSHTHSFTHSLCCPFAALSLRPFAREGVPNSFALFTSCLLLQRTLRPVFLSPSLSPSFSLWLLQPDCISLFCLTFGVRSLARSPALVSHSSSSPSPPLSSFRRTKGKCLNSPRIELIEATLSAFA